MRSVSPLLPADESASAHPDRRYRVLFLADHLGLPDGGVHGVTTYLLDVLPALQSAGIDVAACFLRDPHPAAEVLRRHGIAVHFLGSGRFDLLVLRRVGELVRRGGFGIVHCTQYRATVIGRAVAKRRRGLRLVLHVHDMQMPPVAVRLMNRLVAAPAELGLSVSRASREICIRGYHVAPERVRVLYTGIQTRSFRPVSAAARVRLRLELGVPAEAGALCLVGRFQPVKGHRDMIRMFAEIARSIPDTMLLLIGSGPDRAACERLAAALGLSRRVRFLGHRDDIARLLPAADVLVVPSQSEGLSRVAIEANLCGVPVVAYDSGGIAEALPEPACGELVPAADRAGFIDAVDRALSSSRDPAGIAARVRSAEKRFGLPAHVQALRACYESLEAP